MKKYKVNVNGTEYEITLEVVEGEDIKAPKADANSEKPAENTSVGGETVNSPMPGNILQVNVSEGDTVKKGQVLMVLEAMKMENEIMAPCDGKVTSVKVSKGAAVETGAVLCTIA